MKGYAFYIGLGTENSTDRSVPQYQIGWLKRTAVNRFGGYSLAIVDGGWVGPNGDLVEEKALRFEVFGDFTIDSMEDFGKEIKVVFRQQAVLVAKTSERAWMV